MPRSAKPRLDDIIEAIGVIQSELDGVALEAFEADRRRRWLVERALEILSEASRHLSDATKARHPGIPWKKVAGIGNVLRHEYTRIAAPLLWALARDDLPALERACRLELLLEERAAENE
jgi:uncharacterized protein with HEPN domain